MALIATENFPMLPNVALQLEAHTTRRQGDHLACDPLKNIFCWMFCKSSIIWRSFKLAHTKISTACETMRSIVRTSLKGKLQQNISSILQNFRLTISIPNRASIDFWHYQRYFLIQNLGAQKLFCSAQHQTNILRSPNFYEIVETAKCGR